MCVSSAIIILHKKILFEILQFKIDLNSDMKITFISYNKNVSTSVGDPDQVFGSPGSGSGSVSQRYGSEIRIIKQK